MGKIFCRKPISIITSFEAGTSARWAMPELQNATLRSLFGNFFLEWLIKNRLNIYFEKKKYIL